MVQVQLNNGDILSIKKDILQSIFPEEDLNDTVIIPLTFVNANDFISFVDNYDSLKEGKSFSFDETIRYINVALALQLYDIVDINKKSLLISLENLSILTSHKDDILSELSKLNDDISNEILSELTSYTIKDTLIDYASWDLLTVVKHNNTKTTLKIYDRGILTDEIVRNYEIESVGIDSNHVIVVPPQNGYSTNFKMARDGQRYGIERPCSYNTLIYNKYSELQYRVDNELRYFSSNLNKTIKINIKYPINRFSGKKEYNDTYYSSDEEYMVVDEEYSDDDEYFNELFSTPKRYFEIYDVDTQNRKYIMSEEQRLYLSENSNLNYIFSSDEKYLLLDLVHESYIVDTTTAQVVSERIYDTDSYFEEEANSIQLFVQKSTIGDSGIYILCECVEKDTNGKKSKSYYIVKYIPFIDKDGNYVDYSINDGRIIYDGSNKNKISNINFINGSSDSVGLNVTYVNGTNDFIVLRYNSVEGNTLVEFVNNLL